MGGCIFFKSSSVLLLLCKYIFLLHRQAGMLTHKPCKELKLARADGEKERVILKFLHKKTTQIQDNKKKAKLNK